jgi:hypothetical protein
MATYPTRWTILRTRSRSSMACFTVARTPSAARRAASCPCSTVTSRPILPGCLIFPLSLGSLPEMKRRFPDLTLWTYDPRGLPTSGRV